MHLHNGGEDADAAGMAVVLWEVFSAISYVVWRPYAPQPVTVQAKTSELHSTRRGHYLENLRIRCTQIIGQAQDLDSATPSFGDV